MSFPFAAKGPPLARASRSAFFLMKVPGSFARITVGWRFFTLRWKLTHADYLDVSAIPAGSGSDRVPNEIPSSSEGFRFRCGKGHFVNLASDEVLVGCVSDRADSCCCHALTLHVKKPVASKFVQKSFRAQKSREGTNPHPASESL